MIVGVGVVVVVVVVVVAVVAVVISVVYIFWLKIGPLFFFTLVSASGYEKKCFK